MASGRFGGRWRSAGILFAVLLLGPSLTVGLSPAPAGATGAGLTTIYPDIDGPSGIAAGPNGDLWFTNEYGDSISELTTAGAVTTFTGTGIADPTAITAGPDNASWFVNSNNSIGEISALGLVKNFPNAAIDAPEGIAEGSDGNLWFTNAGNNMIGMMTPSGTVTTYPSELSSPESIAAGPDGALWFTGDGLIGRITTSGTVTFYSSPDMSAPYDITAGPNDSMWFTDYGNSSIGEISTTTDAISYFTSSTVDEPTAIARGPGNTVWFLNSNNTIGDITATGTIFKRSGPGLRSAEGIAEGSDGNLWFTNGEIGGSEYSVGQVTPAGVVTIYPSVIDDPEGIAAGSDGALWFTNNSDDSIGRISTLGAVTNFAASTISFPRAIAAVPGGNLWFTEAGHSVASITTSGVVTQYTKNTIENPDAITVGPDQKGGGDGGGGPTIWFVNSNTGGGNDTIGEVTATGSIKNFTSPDIGTEVLDITEGADGNLWFTNDSSPYSIGRITPAGVVTLYTNVDIVGPEYIAPGPNKTLWFTQGDNTIGRITTAGVVSIFSSPDITSPFDITAGSDGAMWFSNGYVDSSESIGRITNSGAVTTYRTSATAPFAITTGNDGALWYTGANLIGRMTTSVTPIIMNFIPTHGGPPGSSVIINGQNLGSASAVTFGGISGTITSMSATQIRATVPSGATTGPISVTTPDGTVTTRATFTVT